MASNVVLSEANGTNHSFEMADPKLFYSSLLGMHLALPQWEALFAIISTTIIILGTIVGNVLVIISVFTHTPLKITPNFFIVSLAAADLTVSTCVLPLNVAYMVVGKWIFGSVLCKIWLTSDVLCCTASILNLCAIALDRYYALHDPIKHAQRRSVRYVLAKVLVVWIMSIAICFPPLFGWNDWPDTFTPETPCRLTEEKGYVIYSSMGSFYIPLGIIMFVYLKIYQNTSQRLRSRAKASNLTTSALQHRQQSRDNLLTGIEGRYGGSKATLKVTLQEQMEIVNGQPVHSEVAVGATRVSGDSKTRSTQKTAIVSTHILPRDAQIQNHSLTEGRRPKSEYVRPGKGMKRHHGSVQPHMEAFTHVRHNATESANPELILTDPSSTHQQARCDRSTQVTKKNFTEGQTMNVTDTNTSANTTTATTITTIHNHEDTLLTKTGAGTASSPLGAAAATPSGNSSLYKFINEKAKISLAKERKAARTMTIIVTTFVVCWLPFFLMYVIVPFCSMCSTPSPKVVQIITWLGYVNSTLNPIIYTIFNTDFRIAFSRIVTGKAFGM
ncbi:hypothetical protein TCAL_11222 [Tigriopus californicus]|uniref:G-protein coupled receptors family 1 profile domain-containing protein n=1 Tax=Tigriopus californicus TaxID=6832 RepID=A0A553PLM5_TIGCA|nr:probable G-protein coupled receptor No18 [Tigriopus californicus]XP_059095646.1 probable G-protein coupled receptor No18 [Tigriopus californicus]XP_059095647.1 probable G-protein coupled receptor No18 [Tigriopus californicus]TRY78579.1 hypothetical protein TCAL_11222 [Tigriopus californicus]